MAKLNTVTSGTRPASPAAGEAYFETDTNKIIVWDGSAWTELVSDYAPSFANQYSVNFDGSDDYMQTSSNITFASDFSLSFWIKPTNFNDCWFANQGDASAFISSNNNGDIWLNGTVTGPTVGITRGEWNHIFLSRSGSTITVYKKSATGNASGTITKSGTLSYNLIGRYSSSGFHYLGLMDEVAVFNTALSSTDATNIYNSGVPGDISSLNPVNWWRMGDNNGGTGTTITDAGSGGNDGTLTNGPTFSTTVPS